MMCLVTHSTEPLNMNDTITKLSAKYTVDDDTMWYFTRSEGYRPGGLTEVVVSIKKFSLPQC